MLRRMWWREYKDYPPDAPLKKETVEPGRGIVGCEMHENNGWGLSFHNNPPRTLTGITHGRTRKPTDK